MLPPAKAGDEAVASNVKVESILIQAIPSGRGSYIHAGRRGLAATNPAYNQPALHIKQVSTRGGAASIRIDDPNPDIEFVESEQVARAGKYEIAVQSDTLQINGRNAGNSGFETIAVFRRIGAGGNIGLRTRDQFGGGRGVIGIGDAEKTPSENPANGGILFVENGALKYRGSSGTVTILAPA